MANKKKKKAVKRSKVSKKGKNRKKNVRVSNSSNKSTAKVSSKKNTNVPKTSNVKAKNTTKKSNTNKSKKVNSDFVNTKRKNIRKSVNVKVLISIIIGLTLVSVIVLYLLLIGNSSKGNENIDFENISFDKYLELYKSDKLEFIYLYHKSCVGCDEYEVKLSKLESEYQIKIKKLDYSKLNESELKILKSSNSFLEDGIDVPVILSIKNGDEIGCVTGVREYSALKNFASSSVNPMSGETFAKIDVDDYLSLIGSKNKTFIYICDSGEDNCEKFTSTLEKVTSERNIKVYYLNIKNIISSDDWDRLEGSNKIYDGQWFIPTILVVKNGKIIDYKMESLTESDLIKFLKKNGL